MIQLIVGLKEKKIPFSRIFISARAFIDERVAAPFFLMRRRFHFYGLSAAMNFPKRNTKLYVAVYDMRHFKLKKKTPTIISNSWCEIIEKVRRQIIDTGRLKT